MGYWKEVKKQGDKERVYYRVYCGTDSEGRRIQKNARTPAEAKKLLAMYRSSKSDLDRELLSLSTPAKAEVVAVVRACMRRNVTLTEVWNHWAEVRSKRATQNVSECAELFLDFLTHTNKRSSYCKTFRQWLALLCAEVGKAQFGNVTKEMLLSVYNEIPIRSRQTWRSRANTFFGWGVRNGHIDSNPAQGLEIPKLDRDVPQTLTVGQCKALLRECSIKSMGALVLMLFSGLRPHEAKQIDADAVSLEKGIVTVGAQIAKTRSYRIIKITDNMAAWFRYLLGEGYWFPYSPSNRRMTDAWQEILGLPSWPRDCLRHTAASMMLARDKNADAVALELGNSPTILHRHYKNMVSQADCTAFWAMTPKVVGRRD